VLLDFDNDHDLDLALTDEIADVIVLRRNAGSPTDAAEQSIERSMQPIANLPDPFGAETTIRFRQAQPGDVWIRVLDVSGREVGVSHLQGVQAGWRLQRFDGRALPNGVYFYEVRSAGSVQRDRMTVVR
jgi:hypothetical protein